MKKIEQVCVYCASSQRIDEKYFEAARGLAETLAPRHVTVVFGGGGRGLMGALADRMLELGGKVIGIIPEFMKKVEWDHKGVTELRVVETMHQRKHAFIQNVDAIIALPGGVGTLEELLEAITWKRLGLVTVPIVIVNTDGYYDPLIQMLDRCIREDFMHPDHTQMWSIVRRPEDVIAAIENAPNWDEDVLGIA